MAKRKTIKLREEAKEQLKRFEEIKVLISEADEEEKSNLDKVTSKIKDMEDDFNVFVGIYVSPADVIMLLHTAMEHPGENIQIPAKVYQSNN